MKLYFAPGACSLADHIALHEAGLAFEPVRVDLRTRRTEDGQDFNQVNPKGYVPALVLDDGQLLTENVAILAWVAERAPQLAPQGELGRIRLLEMLAFISSELHKPFVRLFFPTGEADKAAAGKLLDQRFGFVAERLEHDYLFGREAGVADAYLYVMLRWAQMSGVEVPAPLSAYAGRMSARPAVQRALQHEGLA
jgi:glutathione S-transferase